MQVEEEDPYVEKELTARGGVLSTGPSIKKRKEILKKIETYSSRPWLSVQALQAIYQGILVDFIQKRRLDRADAMKVLKYGQELWFTYLESRLLIFGDKSTLINKAGISKKK